MEDMTATSIIVDNWSLQEIGGCLVNGLADGSVDEILINIQHDSHSFKEVPRAAVQIEALLDLLVDIVMSDSIFVDDAFTNTWADSANVFTPITATGLLRAFRFRDHEKLLEEPRKVIVSDLCITSSIKQAQIENEAKWRLERRPENPYMSALVWGTAGYLSRSHIFQAPYHGYPLRNRLIDQALFSPVQRDVITDTKDWLSSERLRIFQSRTQRGISNQLTVVLPPIAVEIINEASDLSQLISVAIQLRDKYQNLRIWLREIQTGVNADSAKDAARFKKTLTAISRDLSAMLGDDDQFKCSLDITWPPAISIEIPILSGIRRKFGISAMLNRLLFLNNGSQALQRLINMFGKKHTGLELVVAKYRSCAASQSLTSHLEDNTQISIKHAVDRFPLFPRRFLHPSMPPSTGARQAGRHGRRQEPSRREGPWMARERRPAASEAHRGAFGRHPGEVVWGTFAETKVPRSREGAKCDLGREAVLELDTRFRGYDG